jgi:hypothetical protein
METHVRSFDRMGGDRWKENTAMTRTTVTSVLTVLGLGRQRAGGGLYGPAIG